jgi:hypothetical protein
MLSRSVPASVSPSAVNGRRGLVGLVLLLSEVGGLLVLIGNEVRAT